MVLKILKNHFLDFIIEKNGNFEDSLIGSVIPLKNFSVSKYLRCLEQLCINSQEKGNSEILTQDTEETKASEAPIAILGCNVVAFQTCIGPLLFSFKKKPCHERVQCGGISNLHKGILVQHLKTLPAKGSMW